MTSVETSSRGLVASPRSLGRRDLREGCRAKGVRARNGRFALERRGAQILEDVRARPACGSALRTRTSARTYVRTGSSHRLDRQTIGTRLSTKGRDYYRSASICVAWRKTSSCGVRECRECVVSPGRSVEFHGGNEARDRGTTVELGSTSIPSRPSRDGARRRLVPDGRRAARTAELPRFPEPPLGPRPVDPSKVGREFPDPTVDAPSCARVVVLAPAQPAADPVRVGRGRTHRHRPALVRSGDDGRQDVVHELARGPREDLRGGDRRELEGRLSIERAQLVEAVGGGHARRAPARCRPGADPYRRRPIKTARLEGEGDDAPDRASCAAPFVPSKPRSSGPESVRQTWTLTYRSVRHRQTYTSARPGPGPAVRRLGVISADEKGKGPARSRGR